MLNEQLTQNVIVEESLRHVLVGCEEHLSNLKLPNPQKRQKAIVEIKKAISQKLQRQMSSHEARELFEPLTLLMRQLLRDENV